MHLLQINATLKRQLESAIPLSANLEELYEKNLDLQNKLHSVQSEKDDLSRRLDISLERIGNLERELNSEVAKNITEARSEVEEMKKRLLEGQKFHSKEVASLKNQLDDNKRLLDDQDEKLQTLQTEMTAILSAASQHFETDICDCDQLIKLLLIPPFQAEAAVIEDVPAPKERKQRVKKVVEIVTKENPVNEVMEQQIAELQMQLEESLNKTERLESENQSLKNANNKARESLAAYKAQMECADIDKNAKHLNEMIEMSGKLKAVTTKLADTERQRETLKKQIKPLMAKMQSLEADLQTSHLENEDLRTEILKMTAEKNQLIDNVGMLSSERETHFAETTSLSNTISYIKNELKDAKTNLASRMTELEGLRLKVGEQTRVLSEEAESKADMQKQIDHLSQLVESTSKALASAQQRMADESEKRDRAESTVRKLKEQLNQQSETMDITELLGIVTFTIDAFPKDLAEVVSQIAANSTLRIPSKLRQMFAAVEQYFTSRHDHIEGELAVLKDRDTERERLLESFNALIRKLFPEAVNDLYNLPANENGQELFSTIVQTLRNERAIANHERQKEEAKLSEILIHIGSNDVESAKSQIQKERADASSCLKNLEKAKRKILSLEKQIQDTKLLCDSRIGVDEFDRCRQQIDHLNNLLKEQECENSERVEALESKNAELNDWNMTLNAKVEALSNTVKELYEQLSRQKEENCALIFENSELKKEVDRNINTISLQKAQKKQLKQQVASMSACQEQKTPRAKVVNEIVNKEIEKRLNLIKEKMTEQSEKIQKLQQELSASESSLSNSIQRAMDLEIKLQKAELDADLATKKFDRDKMIFGANSKKQQAVTENRIRSMEGELASRIAEAKRQVMASVAIRFASLFDAGYELNDQNFESLLDIVREKIMDLVGTECSIRRLLKIGPAQSITAEISRIMIEDRNC